MIGFFKRIFRVLKIGAQIENDFYVKTETRDSYIITYKGHSIRVCVELQSGKPDRIIYKEDQSIRKWLPPHENEPVPEEQYQFIIDTISKYFKKFGDQVVISE